MNTEKQPAKVGDIIDFVNVEAPSGKVYTLRRPTAIDLLSRLGELPMPDLFAGTEGKDVEEIKRIMSARADSTSPTDHTAMARYFKVLLCVGVVSLNVVMDEKGTDAATNTIYVDRIMRSARPWFTSLLISRTVFSVSS